MSDDKLFISVGNRVIQQKSGLNFFAVFTEKDIIGTQQLIEDAVMAKLLANVLNERRDLRKLIVDVAPYVDHGPYCLVYEADPEEPCDCALERIKDRVSAAIKKIQGENDEG